MIKRRICFTAGIVSLIVLLACLVVNADWVWNPVLCKWIYQQPIIQNCTDCGTTDTTEDQDKDEDNTEAEFVCPDRHIQIGMSFSTLNLDDTDLFPYYIGKVEVNVRSGHAWTPLNLSGGLSIGSIRREAAIGANGKFGVTIPVWNIGADIKATWMVNGSGLNFGEVRSTVFYHLSSSRSDGWIYGGGKISALYNPTTKWSGGKGFFLGVAVENCRERFSWGGYIEIKGLQWGDNCSSPKTVPSIEAGVYVSIYTPK